MRSALQPWLVGPVKPCPSLAFTIIVATTLRPTASTGGGACRQLLCSERPEARFNAWLHPSYPAAHACSSIAITKVLGYLFAPDAEAFAALGERAAESRIWAGIHYRSDIIAGRQLAVAVADKVIERAEHDGAER